MIDETVLCARGLFKSFHKDRIEVPVLRGVDLDISQLGEAQIDELLEYLFSKFLGDRSLLGTPESCIKLGHQLIEIGVNELACLIDFGPDPDVIMAGLPLLAQINDAL